jgi:serine kinase of HPr protein (carbohydrate metabolism regulator)
MTGLPLTPPDEILVHGTCVMVGEVGVLIVGPPGSGKSGLALRLIDQPGFGISGEIKRAYLVADDQVSVKREADQLVASAPLVIAGKLEIRGLGLVAVAHRSEAVLGLAIRLAAFGAIERLPDLAASRFEVLGSTLPLVQVDPAYASAPACVRAAVDWLAAT